MFKFRPRRVSEAQEEARGACSCEYFNLSQFTKKKNTTRWFFFGTFMLKTVDGSLSLGIQNENEDATLKMCARIKLYLCTFRSEQNLTSSRKD